MIVTILHNPGSSSARNLQRSLLAAGINATRAIATSVRHCRGERDVINLGVSAEPTRFRQRSIIMSNSLAGVARCQHKFDTFLALMGARVPTLQFIGRIYAGQTLLPRNPVVPWLEEDGKVVVRHTATGHSGAGIQIFRQQQLAQGEAIPNAPLYTRYFRKQAEYRVHVAFGKVILVQQKKKRNGFADLEAPNKELVRTHGNGWVFAINDLASTERGYDEELKALAIDAANAVGCNHCAVDVLVNHDTHQMAVCEINSCPALEAGSTLEAYTNAFREWLS